VNHEYQALYQLERQRGTGVIQQIHVLRYHEREWYLTNDVVEGLPGGVRAGRVAPIIVIVDGHRRRCYGYGYISNDNTMAYIRIVEAYRTIDENAIVTDEVEVTVTRNRP